MLKLATTAAQSLGFDPAVHFDGPVDSAIDDAVAEQLLSVLRELLSNVAKHASASSVDVYLKVGSDVSLLVNDDGTGPGERRAGGQGINNLEQRASAFGGKFEIVAGESGGTAATWRVPRKPPART